MRTRVSRAGFYLLCTLMSPVIVVGYLVWLGKLFAAGRSGVSATAQGPLSARFSEHNFGTRQDDAADRLMRALPGVPRLGLRLTTGPVLLAHRVTGYVPRAFRYPFEGDVAPQYGVDSSHRATRLRAWPHTIRPTIVKELAAPSGGRR